MYEFELEEGAVIHLDGIPYRHLGGGRFEGGTDPKVARDPANEVKPIEPGSRGQYGL